MPVIKGISDEAFHQVTAAPRRYGWHATLKAPFSLSPGADVEQVRAALKKIAASSSTFEMPPLRVARLNDFLAIVPQTHSAAADAVAARCVVELQPLAAALSATELQRRRQAQLTPAQDDLLVSWGYPFVLDQFQFHCSLTGSLRLLKPAQIENLQQTAQDWFADLPPCRFETLALFVEPARGADFMLQEHFRLAA